MQAFSFCITPIFAPDAFLSDSHSVFLYCFPFSLLYSMYFFPLYYKSKTHTHTHVHDTHMSSLFLFWITPLLLVWVFSLLLALNREGRWDSKELPGAQFAHCFDVIQMLWEQTRTHACKTLLHNQIACTPHPPFHMHKYMHAFTTAVHVFLFSHPDHWQHCFLYLWSMKEKPLTPPPPDNSHWEKHLFTKVYCLVKK